MAQLDQLANAVSLASKDPQVLVERMVNQDLLDQLALTDDRVQEASLAHVVKPDQLDPLDQPDNVVNLDHQAPLDQRDPPVNVVKLDSVVNLVLVARLDLLDHPVNIVVCNYLFDKLLKHHNIYISKLFILLFFFFISV